MVEDVAKSLRLVEELPPFSSGGSDLRLLGTPPAESGYDAMHIRRGDNLWEDNAMRAVEKYWVSRGHPPLEGTFDIAGQRGGPTDWFRALSARYPTSYVPFSHYWSQYKTSTSSCPSGNYGERVRRVYLATDAIESVRAEIANLTASHGAEYWINRCNQQVEFVFNSQEKYAKHLAATLQTDQGSQTAVHGHFTKVHGEGYDQYLRTVSAITDLHILSQSDVFVGEFQSYWGRILRTLRTSFQDDEPTTKEFVTAWGETQTSFF